MSAIKTITILTLLLGYLPALNGRQGTEKRTEFGTGIEVGFALAEYHDTCIMFRAFFVSGEFFGGLHRNKPPNDSTFKKAARAFRTFPERLLVDVEATAYSCSGSSGRPLPPDFGEGLLSDPTFEIAWKVGGRARPTTVLPNQIRHKDHSLRWDYFLEIPARDIPLTEELIVDVSMRGGVNRCQISARLK